VWPEEQQGGEEVFSEGEAKRTGSGTWGNAERIQKSPGQKDGKGAA